MQNPSRIVVLAAIIGLIVALGGLNIGFLPGSSVAWWTAVGVGIWFLFIKEGGCCNAGKRCGNSGANTDTEA